ncbi:hypothetical protein NX059_006494 [Plenodomus lindquistii]|nr:hypothetical protein NX059_006494 [Plenodomus lindquistii]
MGNTASKKKTVPKDYGRELYAIYARQDQEKDSDPLDNIVHDTSSEEFQKETNQQGHNYEPDWNRNRFRSSKIVRGMAASHKFMSAAHRTTTKLPQKLRSKINASLNEKVEAIKTSVTGMTRAVRAWVKAHPWQAAAIVITIILIACTPAFLHIAGFTAGGIAAASLAAGIQSGIGCVAAGSTFAVLTSAMMGGYGVFVVFGAPWIILSAIIGGVTLWSRGIGPLLGRNGRTENTTHRAAGANGDNNDVNGYGIGGHHQSLR